MLKIMEDEVKIFVAWLDKFVRKDKKMYGNKLAKLVGVSPPTITGYCDGRTEPSFKIRKLILEATDTPYEKMMVVGRKELAKKEYTTLSEKAIRKIAAEEVKKQISPITVTNDLENHETKKNIKHHKIVDQFQQPELALELNEILLKIEKKKMVRFKKIKKFLLAELEELEEETPKEDRNVPGEETGN